MGPLHGVKIVEVVGIGPGPFAAMVLADMGADVVRIERPGAASTVADARHFLARGKRSMTVDLKRPEGVAAALRLIERSDVLIEGFRPGVMERLGLGPEPCFERNPALVYGRMTGFGQTGPLAERAGHDIDYIALTGALHAIGRAGEPPVAPINLIGDFGGGGLLLAFGIVCALRHAQVSGAGQVVDAAMVDGASLLMTMAYSMRALGLHSDVRGTNLLDTGAHFYEVYGTADDKFVAVGAIEPQFYEALLRGLGLLGEDLPPQMDRRSWASMKQRFARIFRQKTRDEWMAVFEGTDACVGPVLSMEEAPHGTHLKARDTFLEIGGFVQPAPAPRFGASTPQAPSPPAPVGAHTREVLLELGFEDAEIEALRASGVVNWRP